MIIVKRAVVLGLVLLAGACSRLPNVPTAYSALPPGAGDTASLRAAPAEPATLLPVVILPGTLKDLGVRSAPPGVNPNAVLDASMRTRMTWESLRPADLLKPPALGAAGSATAGLARPERPTIAALIYDREAAMDRLLKGGRGVEKSICSGC